MVLCYLIVISLLIVACSETSYSKVQNRVVAGNEFESTANKTSGIRTVTMGEAPMNQDNEINADRISENNSKGLTFNPSQILLQISETISNDIKLYTTATNVIIFIGQMIDAFLSRNTVKEQSLPNSMLPEERENSEADTFVEGVGNDIYNTAILTCLVREARVIEQKTHTGECILLLLCKVAPFVFKIQEYITNTYNENMESGFIEKNVTPEIKSYKQHEFFCQKKYFKCNTYA